VPSGYQRLSQRSSTQTNVEVKEIAAAAFRKVPAVSVSQETTKRSKKNTATMSAASSGEMGGFSLAAAFQGLEKTGDALRRVQGDDNNDQ
jgi:hypothetical protein